MEYQHDEHHVHLIVYHVIWCPKRRKKFLLIRSDKDVKTSFDKSVRKKDGPW